MHRCSIGGVLLSIMRAARVLTSGVGCIPAGLRQGANGEVSPLSDICSANCCHALHAWQAKTMEYAFFGVTLLGVALFHQRALLVALVGLSSVVLLQIASGPSLEMAAYEILAHLADEWVILTNLLLLLLGFAVLTNQFEQSGLPEVIPSWLVRRRRAAWSCVPALDLPGQYCRGDHRRRGGASCFPPALTLAKFPLPLIASYKFCSTITYNRRGQYLRFENVEMARNHDIQAAQNTSHPTDSVPYDIVVTALRYMGSITAPVLTVMLLVFTCLVGLLDYLVGSNATFVSLYLIPMSIAAWFLGLAFSYIIASLSTVFWVAGDFGAGIELEGSTLAWNLFSRFAVFAAVSHLVRAQRRLHDDVEAVATKRTAQLIAEIQARQRLEEELVRISDREQRRVGHDIHDSLCQHLTGTALAGQVLVQNLKANESDSAATAARVVELIEDGINLSRNLARGLHSVGRTGDGLMEALEDFAVSTSDLFKISCRFDCPLPVLISDLQTAQHLYRIAQEAVGNAIKHGQAKDIRIRLEAHKGGKRLRIIDDGMGRPPFSSGGKGMGMRIMSYRADRIGATFSVRRREPTGTIVTCYLPLVPVAREPVV